PLGLSFPFPKLSFHLSSLYADYSKWPPALYRLLEVTMLCFLLSWQVNQSCPAHQGENFSAVVASPWPIDKCKLWMVIFTIFLVIFLVILISLILYSSKYLALGYSNTNMQYSIFQKKEKMLLTLEDFLSLALFFSNESSTVIYQLVFSVPPSTEGFMENRMNPDFIRNILRQYIYDEDTLNPGTSECDRLKLNPTSLTCKCCTLEKLFLYREQKYLCERREIFLERY
uniref:Uncharacterized protein n=1 Tax=Zonotrichia albicollis TaxID=44394 RepID=A0A8D2NJC1_ZONAL